MEWMHKYYIFAPMNIFRQRSISSRFLSGKLSNILKSEDKNLYFMNADPHHLLFNLSFIVIVFFHLMSHAQKIRVDVHI